MCTKKVRARVSIEIRAIFLVDRALQTGAAWLPISLGKVGLEGVPSTLKVRLDGYDLLQMFVQVVAEL